MTAAAFGPSVAWTAYLDREHAARRKYLATIERAGEEYLVGPWPDRDSYTIAERDAWATYYHAGRAAWQQYRADLDTAPPVSRETSDASNPYPTGEGPWLPPFDRIERPTFTAHPERMQ
jgi:hypothetical protein